MHYPDGGESPEEPERRRLRRARERLREGAGDALVLFPSPNLEYLSGFRESPGERHLLLFVPSDGEPLFFVPELYRDQVERDSRVGDVRTWGDDEEPLSRLERIARELGLADGHLLIDDTMWARFTQDLRTACPDATFGLASEVLARLRSRKDAAEIDALDRAGDVFDAAMADVRDLGERAIGMTETELGGWIGERLAEHGGTGTSFETIVGSGPNGAMPHHTHGDREIRPGDPVVLDFGTRVDGYPSDGTRTVVFAGEPDREFREVHGIVREAQNAAVEAVEPGETVGTVDAAAREVIEEAGYGDRFIHRTGHGIGLDVHEEPYVVADGDRVLETGMAFSVEPGIYLPDSFGVRIEDVVVVTEGGARRLTHADRGWRVG
ncbi:MAG: Xaa-Pro peptidase family protein [Haloferacaceae archaeon]